MDRLCSTIPHQIPAYNKGSHRDLTLQEAARLLSPAELIQVRCGCKGNCATIHCSCFNAKVDCPLHCHCRNDGINCTNTGASIALSGTFSLALNPARIDQPGPSQNPKRRRANTRGDTWQSTSVEDSARAGAEDSTGSDLSELDTEQGEDYEADAVTEEKEGEEDEDDEGSEDEGSEDEVCEEQTVSSNDMRHSVIVVVPRR